ncbi:MAG TPA: hypothetical protein VG125_07665, partial [Pirellulales bacterium]|nr:hypothetical protein [Pirellulales bacterium]
MACAAARSEQLLAAGLISFPAGKTAKSKKGENMENRSVMGVHDVQAYLGEMVRTIARSLGIADVE